MIDLMLDTLRQQPVRLQFLRFAFLVEVADANALRPRHLAEVLGQRETALVAYGRLRRGPENLRVDHAIGLDRFLRLRNVDDDNPLQYPDLRRGEADAARGVHR